MPLLFSAVDEAKLESVFRLSVGSASLPPLEPPMLLPCATEEEKKEEEEALRKAEKEIKEEEENGDRDEGRSLPVPFVSVGKGQKKETFLRPPHGPPSRASPPPTESAVPPHPHWETGWLPPGKNLPPFLPWLFLPRDGASYPCQVREGEEEEEEEDILKEKGSKEGRKERKASLPSTGPSKRALVVEVLRDGRREGGREDMEQEGCL